MKHLLAAAAVAALLAGAAGAVQAADRHDDHHQRVVHKEWRRGAKIEHGDWDRGHAIDWRNYHLNEPGRGYEWREVDGNWVLAEVATGVIVSVLQAED
jgi:Ni/Co efflux regulator RcnB